MKDHPAIKKPTTRKDGRFVPGMSGNPDGRPKGSKNQITLLKEFLELQLREQSASKLPAILDKAMELAEQGDKSMIKLLLELHMSKGTTQDNSKAAEKVQINISGPTVEKKEESTSKQSIGTDTPTQQHEVH